MLLSLDTQLHRGLQQTQVLADLFTMERENISNKMKETDQHHFELAKQALELESRKQEIQNTVGVLVTVRRIHSASPSSLTGTDYDLNNLTKAILKQLGIVMDRFERHQKNRVCVE